MSILKDKSIESLVSGDILKRQRKYNSCIHSYYYSVFQLIKNIENENEEEFYEFEREIINTNLGSHEKLILTFIKYIDKNGYSPNDFSLVMAIDTLKEFRNTADYLLEKIEESGADASCKIAYELYSYFYNNNWANKK